MRMIAALLGGLIACASATEVPPRPLEDRPQRVQLADRPLQVQLVEDATGEAHTREREAKTDKHDAEDLLAQQVAATSAATQAQLALWSLALSFVAACGAFISLWFTRLSLAQTAKSLAQAADTARKELRAYLGLADVHARTLGKQHIQIEIKVTNAGQTPAHDVRQGIRAVIVDGGTKPAFEEPVFDRGGFVLVPGVEHVIHFDLDFLADFTMEDIHEGKKSIYVWGFVLYKDIYGKEQSVHFRYKDLAERWESATTQPDDDEEQVRPDPGKDFLTGWIFMPDFEGNSST